VEILFLGLAHCYPTGSLEKVNYETTFIKNIDILISETCVDCILVSKVFAR